MADFVNRLITLVQEHGPAEAERRIRAEEGSQWVYVAKRPRVDRAQQLGALLQQGMSPLEAFRQAGVSPSTGFRVLRMKQRVPNRG